MAQYLVYHRGTQLGPLNKEQVVEKLKSHFLGWGDRIFDSETHSWCALIDHPEFKGLFGQVHTPGPKTLRLVREDSGSSLAEWYVLKEEKESGPYSFHEMIRQLQERKINAWDLAWNATQEVWKPISEISEFDEERIKSLRQSGQPMVSELFLLRRFQRAPYEASLVVHHNKVTRHGKSMEISRGGAGILLDDFDLEPGQTLFLHFKAGEGIPSFNALCAVVSKQSTRPGLTEIRYGVKFISIMKTIQQAIEAFTEQSKGEAS